MKQKGFTLFPEQIEYLKAQVEKAKAEGVHTTMSHIVRKAINILMKREVK